MTDQPDLYGNLDRGCRCPRCTGRDDDHWPDWAEPSDDWRPIQTIPVAGGRL